MHSSFISSAIPILLIITFTMFFFSQTLPANAAGFRVLFHDDVEVGVWYPHARPLVNATSFHLPTDLQSIPGHHYAFVAPFPKWLTDKENIPAAFDPEGFDRKPFLAELNARILSVFLAK
ncbi:MAG: hypothetical protein OXF24_04855 [Hyphomicrobiales bacterium]|nr:hypothetical protein [Hyphomicrobiales bacterium]